MTPRGLLVCVSVLLMLAGCLLILAHIDDSDAETSGQCGDNVHWTYYPEQSRLVISGSGGIYDYNSSDVMWGGNLDSSGDSITVEIGEGVTTIGTFSFHDCGGMTAIALPDSLTGIGAYAFSGCTNLHSICIPKGVTSIGDEAFSGCTGLTSVTVAEDNTQYQSHEGVLYTEGLGELILCPASKTGSYTLPDGVKVIKINGFRDSRLSAVSLPDTLETIELYAFWFCENLVTLDIPANVKSIGINMVYECPKLEAVNVASDNKYYCSDGGVLFDKIMTRLMACPTAKSGAYDVPDGVRSIDDFAFSGCKITSVTTPRGLTTIGEFAFYRCTLLGSVTMAIGPTQINESTFQDCSSLSTVVLPDSMTTIRNWAFLNCSSISSIAIPYSVSTLESDAFDVSFYDGSGQKLNNTPGDLRGHLFEEKDGKLTAVSPGVRTITFDPSGGNTDYGSLTTSTDGRIGQLPNAH